MLKASKKILLTVLLLISIVALTLSVNFTQDGKQAYADELVTADITQQDGLGLGINVLTATRLNDYKKGYSILDNAKLQELDKSQLTTNRSFPESYSTTNIRNLLIQNTFDFGVDVEYASFFESFRTEINISSTSSYSDYLFKYYFAYRQNIIKFERYINDYAQKSTYQGKFSTSFLTDLDNLKYGNMTYDTFFNRYGTHLIGSAIYGGRLKAYYTVFSNSVAVNEEFKGEIDDELSVISNLSSLTANSIRASLSSLLDVEVTESNVFTGFSVVSEGGSAIPVIDIDSFHSAYNSWCESFEQAGNSVIIDYNEGGIVPLWDILPDGYESVATAMEDRFTVLCANARNSFIDEFKTSNHVDFNGGSGTVADPFLISTPTHLANVNKFMYANYSMQNNINLSSVSEWTAIGGHYREKPFTGTFDGNNYEIQNLRRTLDIPEQNNRIYFGLFGYIGSDGVVENLRFTNININMTGPAVNNPNTRVYVGSVAGSCWGTIENVFVRSGKISYNCCTDGTSNVGGIAGIANNAMIDDCINYADITSGRYSGIAGGITGYISNTSLIDCINSGSVTTYCTGWGGNSYASGISGEAQSGTYYIISCSNSGNLFAERYGWGIGAEQTTYATTRETSANFE